MPPEHARLAKILEEAAIRYGSRRKLAKALKIAPAAINFIIDGERFVTPTQAAKIEVVLGIGAHELLLEAEAHRLNETLPAILARVRKEFGK